jgi:hypothetical protein
MLVPLSEYTTIHPSIDGHLDGFQYFLINNSPVNIFTHISIDVYVRNSSSITLALVSNAAPQASLYTCRIGTYLYSRTPGHPWHIKV